MTASRVPISYDSGFPLNNLPYGVVVTSPDDEPHVAVAIGNSVFDLRSAGDAGLLGDDADLVGGPSLDALLSTDRGRWASLRARLTELLAEDSSRRDAIERHVLPMAAVECRMPFTVGDYVDFYSSLDHATNVGRILRPDGEPLLPNWRHLPVGYHGRGGTVVVSGTPIARPWGQVLDPGADAPRFGPSSMLDFELEVGFVIGGAGNRLGEPIAVDDAVEHIFGFVLVNDWSARDIQSWEYQPLGPFLAKSFATSVSPWVVPTAALQGAWVTGPPQDPAPLPHLRGVEPRGLDLDLFVDVRAGGHPEWTTVTRTSFASMYWGPAQQLAHLTSNGATVKAGDLCASGTVSGAAAGTHGSLLEATRLGTQPITLAGGVERGFLQDGDEVRMQARAGEIGLGEVVGTVVARAV